MRADRWFGMTPELVLVTSLPEGCKPLRTADFGV
jgi:hypothetical protein